MGGLGERYEIKYSINMNYCYHNWYLICESGRFEGGKAFKIQRQFFVVMIVDNHFTIYTYYQNFLLYTLNIYNFYLLVIPQ